MTSETQMTSESSDGPSEVAKNRADFIKRLFAVTVSVGFANQLIQMKWVKDNQFPGVGEFPHIIFLVLGLFLVIQSWEGYFVTLEDRPLEDPARFYIDTTIVFAYLVLLSVSKGTATFLFVICVIFFLYIVWDLLTFREYHPEYNVADGRVATYLCNTAKAIRQPSTLRPKLLTLLAFAWFLEVYGTYLQIKKVPGSIYAIAAAVFLGLWVYRSDQARRSNAWAIIVALFFGLFIFLYSAIWR
jgi:hypothetical protein